MDFRQAAGNRLHDLVLPQANVLTQQPLAFAGVTRLQRLENRAVFFLGMVATYIFHVDPADEANTCVQVHQDAVQFGVARHTRNAQMEALVKLDQLLDRRVRGHQPAANQKGGSLGNFGIGGTFDRQLEAGALDRHPGLVERERLLHIQLPTDETAVGWQQKAVVDQPCERLPHRCAAYTEALSQLNLTDLLPRLELVGDRHVAQSVEYAGTPFAADVGDGCTHVRQSYRVIESG